MLTVMDIEQKFHDMRTLAHACPTDVVAKYMNVSHVALELMGVSEDCIAFIAIPFGPD